MEENEVVMNIAIVGRIKQGDIYAAMRARNWSARDVARFIGASPGAIYTMLNLKGVPNLTLEQELKLEELTGKTVEELLPKEFRAKEFLRGKREMVAFRDVNPKSLIGSGVRCLPISLSEKEELQMSLLEQALTQLGDRDREVIGLAVIEERTDDEIAEELNISMPRVKYIKTEALRRLRIRVDGLRRDLPDGKRRLSY